MRDATGSTSVELFAAGDVFHAYKIVGADICQNLFVGLLFGVVAYELCLLFHSERVLKNVIDICIFSFYRPLLLMHLF